MRSSDVSWFRPMTHGVSVSYGFGLWRCGAQPLYQTVLLRPTADRATCRIRALAPLATTKTSSKAPKCVHVFFNRVKFKAVQSTKWENKASKDEIEDRRRRRRRYLFFLIKRIEKSEGQEGQAKGSTLEGYHTHPYSMNLNILNDMIWTDLDWFGRVMAVMVGILDVFDGFWLRGSVAQRTTFMTYVPNGFVDV